jgi:glycosyltransferase involved in cell wall biosynthesis
MRVVHLTTSGDLGGAETSLLAMLGSVREAEASWELSVIAPAAGRLLERLRSEGIRARVVAFPARLARMGERRHRFGVLQNGAALVESALYARRLASALEEERAEIVHAHGFKMHVLSALARPRGCSVVWHVHGYLCGRPRTARALRALARRTSAVLANSASVAADVQRALGPQALVRTVHNAVDLDVFSPVGSRVDLDAAAGLHPPADGTVRVGLIGTFARWKGHLVFLDALARISPHVPLRGYIVGAPIYATDRSQFSLEDLRHAAHARGLGSRLAFCGFIDNVAGAMRSLDVVVHASTEPEPFGMVLAEAMACGRAVVASRAGGALELFEDGGDAIGHDPGDVEGLARVLETLAANPSLRQRLGLAARGTAETRFDRRRLAEHLVPLYRTLKGA